MPSVVESVFVSPPNLYVEALTYNVTVFELLGFNEVIRGGPKSGRISVLIRIDTRELPLSLPFFLLVFLSISLSVCLSSLVCTRKGYVSTHQGEAAVCSSKGELSLDTDPSETLILPTSSFRNGEINSCCLSRPVCGVLLMAA